MNVERALESLFSATSLALIFFIASCILYLQNRELKRENHTCQYSLTEAYLRLSPTAKQVLQEQFQLRVDILEDMSDRDPSD